MQKKISCALPESLQTWTSYVAQGRTPPYMASHQLGQESAGALQSGGKAVSGQLRPPGAEGWRLLYRVPAGRDKPVRGQASHGLCDSNKEGWRGCLFLSTIMPTELSFSCAWYAHTPLNQTDWSRMQYIPLFLYRLRWNIKVSYYDQKTSWELCRYMLWSTKGAGCWSIP